MASVRAPVGRRTPPRWRPGMVTLWACLVQTSLYAAIWMHRGNEPMAIRNVVFAWLCAVGIVAFRRPW